MTNDPLYNRLLELSWKQKLTDAQEAQMRAWLAAHADCLPDWEAETSLNNALGQLPHVPVPTNFTAQVLQRLDSEVAAETRHRPAGWRIWRQRWLPRMGFAVVVLGAGLFSYHQVRMDQRRAYLRSVEVVSDVASLPSPKILEDFDAIRALNATPATPLWRLRPRLEDYSGADEQLLALMQ